VGLRVVLVHATLVPTDRFHGATSGNVSHEDVVHPIHSNPPALLWAWVSGGRQAQSSICQENMGVVADQTIFNASTIADRLALGTDALRRFAKTHRLPLRLRKLTKAKLTWHSNKYPCLCVSGYDAYVVGRWMEGLLAAYEDSYPEIYTMLWASNKAMSLQYHANRFLTVDEKASLQTLGDIFLRTYMYMAHTAVHEHKFLWRVRPKMHMLCHIFRSPRCINQSVYSTWMDEDFLKKCGKTLGLTTNKTAQQRLLQRWLLQLPPNLVKTLGVRS